MAKAIAHAAEQHRSALAEAWLGTRLPDWPAPCVIKVDSAARRTTGMTSYVFRHGVPVDWEMELSGNEAALLSTVLPHEVMHTVLATHFGYALPRWAEEGVCTVVEPAAELARHEQAVHKLISQQGTMSLDKLFALQQYPRDPVPFYMQSYSISSYLIDQKGRQAFVKFVGEGSRTNDWAKALRRHYGVAGFQALERAWISAVQAKVDVGGSAVVSRN
jgi:hypothetical protein